MKVCFYSLTGYSESKKVGTASLVDGEIKIEGPDAGLLEMLNHPTMEWKTFKYLTQKDGARWLKNLPYAFHGTYFWAELEK